MRCFRLGGRKQKQNRLARSALNFYRGGSITSFSLSVVVPAYNESERLAKSLHIIFDYLNHEFPASELIVVDDGSSDDTRGLAERAFADAGRVEARLVHYEPNRGKGYAVRAGLLASRSPIALFSDADLSTPITETPKLCEAIIRDGVDLAFGSRALDRSLIGTHQPWRREQGGRVFNLIVRLATRLPFGDTQCGFKAFKMSTCRPIIEGSTIERFGFDVELIYVAQLAGLRLREIAVRWDHVDASKVSVWRDSRRMVKEVNTIRQQARQGMYEKAIGAARGAAKQAEAAPVN